MCASMNLGNSGSDLVSRISNKIYEAARAKTIQLPGFPDFAPTIAALREGTTSQSSSAEYKVCVSQGGRLKVLESFASKWIGEENLKDRAMELIEGHNKNFNPDGELWVEDRRPN